MFDGLQIKPVSTLVGPQIMEVPTLALIQMVEVSSVVGLLIIKVSTLVELWILEVVGTDDTPNYRNVYTSNTSNLRLECLNCYLHCLDLRWRCLLSSPH